ncbi:serine/threonine protein kinase [Micromonospora sp. A202]|uniref:tetratricopeptide repeat protein n=1 Tax=Micromonospora sp. A202 TaxID=2572899 RepID=UPI0011734A22|nr:tetratricopeptide repeat protein [Micromonospora sp. A202]TQJ23779.1 serine/threonine protein kinase [Micromonospora sp. A202]
MTKNAYTFAAPEYLRRAVTPSDSEDAHVHRVGDVVQLIIRQPPVEILARHIGGFGAVYVTRSTVDGAVSAVKTPRIDRYRDKRTLDDFAREATLWRNLPPHQFVLPALRVFRYDSRPYVQMPYVSPLTPSGSTLASLLSEGARHGGLASGILTMVVGQLLQALAFMEDAVPEFAHGDIKPGNVLLNAPGGLLSDEISAQLSDFGLARVLNEPGSPAGISGDLYYLPTEWLRPGAVVDSPAGQPITKLQDLYAFGCTAMELLLNLRWQAPDPADGQWRTLADQGFTLNDLRRARPDIGDRPLGVLWRCVAVPPEQAWSSFLELTQAWQEAMAARPGVVFRDLSSWTRLGADLVADSTAESNGAYSYLTRSGTATVEEASRVAAALWDASQLRAVGRVEESSEILSEIHRAYPRLATVAASTAHGLLLLEDRCTEAVPLYRHAVDLYRADDLQRDLDSLGFAAACTTLAQLLLLEDNEDGAAEAAAILAREAIAADSSIGLTHITLAYALMALGDFDGTIEALNRAERLDPGRSSIKIARRIARGLAGGAFLDPVGIDDLDPDQRARARVWWASLSPPLREMNRLHEVGRFDDAATVVADAIGLCRQQGDRGGEAQGLAFLANTMRRAGRLDEAAAAFQDAAALFTAISRPHSGADAAVSVGSIRYEQGRFADAAAALGQATGVFSPATQKFRRARAELELSKALGKLRRWDEAMAAARTAVRLQGELDAPADEAFAWFILGELHREAGQTKAALAPLRKALELYRSVEDDLGAGSALDHLGLVLAALGRPAQGLDLCRDAVTLLTAADDRHAVLVARGHMVALLVGEKLFDQAIQLAKDALEADPAAATDPGAAAVFNNLGLALAGRSRFCEAVEAHRRAAELHEADHNAAHQSLALNNMGAALRAAGNLDGAAAVFRTAVRLGVQAGDPGREASALFNLGTVHADAEDYLAAEATQRRAADLYDAAGEIEQKGRALHQIGEALSAMGRLEEAAASYEAAVEARRHGADRVGLGRSYFQLGMVRHQLGHHDVAVDALSEDLAICRAVGDVSGEAQTLCNLGDVFRAAGRLDDAEAATRSAAQRYADAGNHAEQGETLYSLGRYLGERQRSAEAEQTLRESAEALERAGEAAVRSMVLTELSLELTRSGQIEEAEAQCRTAVAMSKTLDQPLVAGYAYMGLGVVLSVAGNLSEAVHALTCAHDCFAKKNESELVSRTSQLLANVTAAITAGDGRP